MSEAADLFLFLALLSTALTALTQLAGLRVIGARFGKAEPPARASRLREGIGARHAKAEPAQPFPRAGGPAISVLKPLKGLEDGLLENLLSFTRQEYGEFELILGTRDADDPALFIAREVQRRAPHVRVVVVSGARDVGQNPKVSNLIHLARHARHELLLISDSNVRVGPRYLQRAATTREERGVGLVSHVVAGVGEESVGATLENLHLNSFVAAAVAAGTTLGHPCVVGKSMLLSRTDLSRLGGFEAFKDLLAEDYALGQAFYRAGLGVAIAQDPVSTVNVHWSLRRFWSRHLRWAQMRRRTVPLAYFVEPLLYPLLWCVLLGLAGNGLAALVLASLKIALDVCLASRLRRKRLPLVDVAWIPIKDAALIALWIVGMFRRRVEWRGNTLFVGDGGVLLTTLAPTPQHEALEPRSLQIALFETHNPRIDEKHNEHGLGAAVAHSGGHDASHSSLVGLGDRNTGEPLFVQR